MKKLLWLIVLGIIGVGSVQASAALQTDAPAITSFTTTVTIVDRAALHNRRVRIPVSWQTVNRPIFANLYFEQVFADGSFINVELPRLLPWVASEGDGIAAPIEPSGEVDEIVLRVRLINLLTQEVYSEQQITLPIGSTGDTGSDSGFVPTITQFAATSTPVLRSQLENGTARIPVQWVTKDRPLTANLVFEQVVSADNIVNVELPRSIPWVSSSGTGVVAPKLPASGDQILLRVRLIDLVNGRIYDQRFASVDVIEQADPTIRIFSTSAVSVNASQLQQHTARIPVTWAVDNRPANANLVFEQQLPDGQIVNVELPRSNPIVPSSGNGVVAPQAPGGDETTILLQVRLIDVTSEEEYARREITLPINDDQEPPAIDIFSTTALKVSAQALKAHTARIPVTWAVSNRPANANLVFEQRLPDGQIVNVELPRSNPIVPSSGNGVTAPQWPGDDETTILLQVRLIDVTSEEEYAKREITLLIDDDQVSPEIDVFSTTALNVSAQALKAHTARIPVTWAVSNRPANANLVFEQRLPDGRSVNVELPRSDPIVPSSGIGVTAPQWPGDGQSAIILVLRLIDLSGGATLVSTEINVPILDNSDQSGYQTGAVCLQSPYAASNGTGIGTVGRVLDGTGITSLPVYDQPTGSVIGSVAVGGVFDVLDGPACWQVLTAASADQYEFRAWRIRARSSGLEGWVEEYGRQDAGSPFSYFEVVEDQDQLAAINSFIADPTTVALGGTVTLSWNVSNASSVQIQAVQPDDQFGQTWTELPLVGTLNYALPDEYTELARFQLSIQDVEGRQADVETLTVNVSCPFTNTYDGCPMSQTSAQGVYQAFEHGLMVWRGDTRQIYVLYDNGTYQTYADTWTSDQPVDTGETPPSGLILPAHGFGKVWADQAGVRTALGWATGQEISYTAQIEVYTVPGESTNAVYLNIPDGRTLILGASWQIG